MKEYASWSIHHYDCLSYCAPKRFQSSEVMRAHFSSSLQLVIMLGGSVALTHAGDTLTKMIRIQLLASISLTLPRMWLWLPEECVCAQHFKPARGCATFGSLACCLHLNPQEMENGLRFLKLTLRSDGLKMQLLGLSLWALLQLLGQKQSAINKTKSTVWHLKTKPYNYSNVVHMQVAWLYAQRLASAVQFGSQRGTADRCGLTSCYVFSAGMQGWTVVLLPLSHFSQRSNTAPPPPSREAFVLQRHSMSLMGDDYRGLGWKGLPAWTVSGSGTGERGSSLTAQCYISVMRWAW